MKLDDKAQRPKPLQKAEKFDVIKLGHLESGQVSLMLGFLFGTKVFLTLPSFITARSGTGAWITISGSAILASVGLWGWLRWSQLTGNLGIVPSLRLTLGRVLGDLVTLFLTVYFLLITSFSVRVFAGGAVIGLLPEFPIELLLSIVIVSAIHAAWLGLEPVARAATFFFPIIVVSIILVALGSYTIFDIRNMYPIFGMGLPVLLKESILHVGVFGAISVTAILKSYVRNPDTLPRSAYSSLVITTLFMIGSIVLVSATFPYPENTRQVIPLGVVARAVHLGRFAQRIEALFMFTWFFASAVHASVCYMVSLILLSQLMNTRTYRPLVPGVTLLTFGIAALPRSILAAGRILSELYLSVGSVNVALGLLLYAVAHKRNTEKEASQISQMLLSLKQSPGYSEDISKPNSVILDESANTHISKQPGKHK